MRRDKPPPRTLRLLLAENYYTASASGPSDNLKNPETLGLPTASREKPVCKGPSAKPTEVQKPIHNVKDQTRRHKTAGNNEREWIAPPVTLGVVEATGIEPPASGRRDFFCRFDSPGAPFKPSPVTLGVVEATGIEPVTFCLQSRCSPN